MLVSWQAGLLMCLSHIINQDFLLCVGSKTKNHSLIDCGFSGKGGDFLI